jgi:tetratricopeptide (TPR) repeat protein
LFFISLPILIYLGRSTFRTFHLCICLAKLFLQLARRLGGDRLVSYINPAKPRDLGDYQGAIHDYTESIRIDPNNIDAYKSLANIKEEMEWMNSGANC